MRKNGFLTFCFSFIPGAGQMYQGYMKRGLSIMIVFGAILAMAIVVSIPLLTIPLPIIFAYSFFDTFHVRSKINAEKTEEDDYIWNELSETKLFDSIKGSKGNKVIATILIVFGVYILLNNIVGELAYKSQIYFVSDFIYNIMRYLPAGIIATICIYGGAKLISKDNK